MENIQELIKQHIDNNIIIEKKQASIEKLKNQIKKIEEKNSWINVIIKPMAKELSEILDLPVWEILGPFGLDFETSIHFAKNKQDLKSCSKIIKSITFVPIFNGLKDISISVQNYDVSTGSNHPLTDISNTPLKEIAKWVY
jgi:hypothetical protein